MPKAIAGDDCRRSIDRLFFFRSVLFLLVGLHAYGAGAQSMTEAVQIALAQYPTILQAQVQAQSSEAEIGVAQGQHWPQVGWQATQSTYSSVVSTPFDPQNTWIQSPVVSLNIWSGWRIESEVERARALGTAGMRQIDITRDEVALLALEGYLNWARTKDLVNLARDNLRAHERIRRDIAGIVRIDSGRRIDLEQADVRLENARLILRQRESEYEVARFRLSRMLLGATPASPSGLNVKYGAVPNQVDAALTLINDNHPVIAQQIAQVDAAKAGVTSAKSQFSPSVDLTYGKQTGQGTGQNDYLTQVTISMPIFSGGSSYGALQSAHAQLQAQEFALQEIRLNQKERLLTAWADWESAKSRLSAGRQQAKTGSALVKGYEQQFKVGRRSLLDLLTVQNDLLNYQTTAVNSEFEVRVAYARILAAMGRLALAFRLATN